MRDKADEFTSLSCSAGKSPAWFLKPRRVFELYKNWKLLKNPFDFKFQIDKNDWLEPFHKIL